MPDYNLIHKNRAGAPQHPRNTANIHANSGIPLQTLFGIAMSPFPFKLSIAL
jgi:hypothetical protein